MAEQAYRKAEQVLAANVQTQQAVQEQKETQSRLAQLRPVVRNANEQLQVKTQMIVLEAYDALKVGIPPNSSLKTLLG